MFGFPNLLSLSRLSRFGDVEIVLEEPLSSIVAGGRAAALAFPLVLGVAALLALAAEPHSQRNAKHVIYKYYEEPGKSPLLVNPSPER